MTPQEFVCLQNQRTEIDNLFDHKRQVDDFQFDEHITRVFPNMIGRSVPGYWQIVDGIGLLAKHFVQPNTFVYDLGTSLGAVAWSVHQQTRHPVIAVDISEAMISQLKKKPASPKRICGNRTSISRHYRISITKFHISLFS